MQIFLCWLRWMDRTIHEVCTYILRSCGVECSITLFRVIALNQKHVLNVGGPTMPYDVSHTCRVDRHYEDIIQHVI